MSESLRLSVLQTGPCPGATDANIEELKRLAADVAPGLLVTPELSLTGYDLRDRMAEVALTSDEAAARLQDAGSIIAGFPERAPDGAVYNAAAHVADGRVVHVHRKVYLPTYGMFDEGRWFGRGAALDTWSPAPGWRAGVLVCEDFWHPGLVYALCAHRIDVLIAIAAAPGRGVLEGEAGARFASWSTWQRMAEFYARVFGIYVVLANRVGAEDGVTFAGGSLIASPIGELISSANHEAGVSGAVLDRSELARARSPAWHGRDDRPIVVARALMRAEGLGA